MGCYVACCCVHTRRIIRSMIESRIGKGQPRSSKCHYNVNSTLIVHTGVYVHQISCECAWHPQRPISISTWTFCMAFANANNVDARHGQFTTVAGDQYIINQCFSQQPMPHLSKAFSSFKFIVRSVDQVQSSKRQLNVLESTIATLLQTLDGEYREERLSRTTTAGPIADLQQYAIAMPILQYQLI